MNKDITKFAGLDLGDKTSLVYVLDQAGEFVKETRIPTTAAALGREFGRQAPLRIALEVGAHSRWVSREPRRHGHEVVVANASKLRLIYENPRKSDRVDAEYLARLVRLDVKLLAPITHRGEIAQQHLALLRARDSLVRARTQLVNHVHGTAKSFGVRLPPCATEYLPRKAWPELPDKLRPALEAVLKSIQDLSERIQAYDQDIERLCAEVYPETLALRSIKGVGALTALAFVLTLEDPQRFRTSREVGPYLGLTPKRNQSGDEDPEARISKRGDQYLRRLLVGSAQSILGPFGQDSHLRRWGLQLAGAGSKAAKKRAVVAVARKLAVLLHKLWVSGQTYQPFYPLRQQAGLA